MRKTIYCKHITSVEYQPQRFVRPATTDEKISSLISDYFKIQEGEIHQNPFIKIETTNGLYFRQYYEQEEDALKAYNTIKRLLTHNPEYLEFDENGNIL